MKIVIGVSGGSSVNLACKFIDRLPKDLEKYVIFSKSAELVLKKENNISVYDIDDISAPISSGSFHYDCMIVVPCSMNTLAKIACGISDNLITRSATVSLKENRKLILAPREMPFNAINLENMLKLSRLGVCIAPPVLGYYSEQNTLEDMEKFLIGKWFDLLGIENNLYKRWGS